MDKRGHEGQFPQFFPGLISSSVAEKRRVAIWESIDEEEEEEEDFLEN